MANFTTGARAIIKAVKREAMARAPVLYLSQQIKERKRFLRQLEQPGRLSIYRAITTTPASITALSERTGISYKAVYFHVMHLALHGLVKEKKNESAQGRPVLVSRSSIDLSGVIATEKAAISELEKKLAKHRCRKQLLGHR